MSENGQTFVNTLRQLAALWPPDQPWDWSKAIMYVAVDLAVDMPLTEDAFVEEMLRLKAQPREAIVAVR